MGDFRVLCLIGALAACGGSDGRPLSRSDSQDGGTIRNADASGWPVVPRIEVEPTRVEFGDVVLGDVRALPVDVTNRGPERATVRLLPGSPSSRALPACSEGRSDDFCLELPEDARRLSFAIQARQTRRLQVVFRPSRAASRTLARFTLSACSSPRCEARVSVAAGAVPYALDCTPSSLDFGYTALGACSQLDVACANASDRPLQITGVRLEPMDSAFRLSEVGPNLVLEAASADGPGEEAELRVSYCPENPVDQEGTLVVSSDTEAEFVSWQDVRIRLQGTARGPQVSVAPAAIEFGEASSGSESRQTLVVSNVGFEDLQIQSIVCDADGTGAFFCPSDVADVLAPGQSKPNEVVFAPPRRGRFASRLILGISDPDEPEIEIPLTGIGI